MKRSNAVRVTSLAIGIAAAFPALAQAAMLDNLLDSLSVMTPGSWLKVNTNTFSSVTPPQGLKPGYYGSSSRVIPAWSGFTWDSKRGDLLLFGGGHANYSGNEVYRWSGVDQTWSRGSLPSDINVYHVNGYEIVNSKGGVFDAPTSAHTYDTTNYLAVADRMLVLGGAAFNTGGVFQDSAGAQTGPYLWNPAKADPNKVGGATGTGVNVTTPGGNMWENRHAGTAVLDGYTFVEAGSVATVENGKDVVYFSARKWPDWQHELFKYTINDINNPALDTVVKVGAYNNGVGQGPDPRGAAAYDPVSKLYVTVGGNDNAAGSKFSVWDLDNASAGNLVLNVSPTVLGAGTPNVSIYSGIDWDPVLGKFLVWGGGGDVWALSAPADGTAGGEWSLERMTDGASFASGMHPADVIENGVWGKWKYISDLKAYIALGDSPNAAGQGDVWMYKPLGWTNPVPEPSTWMMLLAGASLLGVVARRRATART